MKKKIIRIVVVTVVLLLGILVAINWKQIYKRFFVRKETNRLVAMHIQVAAKNKSSVVHVYYPYYTYRLIPGNAATGDHGGVRQKELARSIRDKEYDKKTLDALDKLLEQMEQDPSAEQNQTSVDRRNYTYHVTLQFKNSQNETVIKRVTGYNALPECWPEFALLINEMIEVDAFDENPELMTFSPEWYRDTFAIDDSVFEYGSLEDMIRSMNLGMADIIGGKAMNPMLSITRYEEQFTALDWQTLDKNVAREIQVVESDEEEFTAFVEEYFEEIYGSAEESYYTYMMHEDGTKYGVFCNRGTYFQIYRSCEWQPEITNDGTYGYIDRSGPEGMTCEYPAYYSPDGKFILVTLDRQEKYYKPFGIEKE